MLFLRDYFYRAPSCAVPGDPVNTFAPRVMAIAIASAFAVNAANAAPAPARAENAYLSQADAMARSARVSNVDYVLDFTLTGKESFAGTTTVSFDLKDTDSAVTLDLDK